MPETTESILKHHLEAYIACDLPAMMEDYTEESVILVRSGRAFQGLAQIESLFQRAFAEFGAPGATFVVGSTAVHGEVALITWSGETAANTYEFGTDTFIIRGGKILVQTFASKATPKTT